MYPIFVIVLGALVFWGLGWTATFRVAPELTRQIAGEVQLRMQDAGLPDDEVVVDGRDVWVAAGLSGDASFARVEAVLADVEGIREVKRRPASPEALGVGEAAFVDIGWSDSVMSVRGALGEETDLSQMMEGLRERFPQMSFVDSLGTEPDVVSAHWEVRIPEVVGIVRQVVPTGGVSARGLSLVVRGIVSNENVRTETGERLRAALPGMRIINRIRTPSISAPVAAALSEIFAGRLIGFQDRSDVLTTESRALLERAAVVLENNPDVTVRIEGYDDNSASPRQSEAVSLVKAEVVRDFLILLGARPNSLVIRGMGTALDTDAEGLENSAGRAAVRLVVDLE